VKLRSIAPALAGLLLLAAIYLVMQLRGRGDEPSAPAALPVAHGPATAPTAPGAAVKPAAKPATPSMLPEVVDDIDPETGKIVPHDDPTLLPNPGMTAKKPKMNLDERLAEAQKHIPVLERRAELIDKEIQTLEAAGKTKEAAEQRIVAKRLRDHAAALRQAIAEHKEPM